MNTTTNTIGEVTSVFSGTINTIGEFSGTVTSVISTFSRLVLFVIVLIVVWNIAKWLRGEEDNTDEGNDSDHPKEKHIGSKRKRRREL